MRIKTLLTAASALALAGCAHAQLTPPGWIGGFIGHKKGGPARAVGGGANPFAALYSGYPQTASFFPIGVWYQNPIRPGTSDNASYTNEATGIAAVGANLMLGIGVGSGTWPATYSGGVATDNGELAAAKSAGLYVLAGDLNNGGVNATSTTAANSANAILALAAAEGNLSTIIGYAGPDEPHCNGSPPYTANIPAEAALVNGEDNTRPLTVNNTAWMFNFGYVNGVDTVGLACRSSFPNNLHAGALASYDDYPQVNAYGGALAGNYARGSDYLTYANDKIWVDAAIIATLNAIKNANQPVWAYLDPGVDALASPTYNTITGSVTSGSTTFTIDAPQVFTTAWNGMKLNPTGGGTAGAGVPADTTLTYVSSTTATMSAAATSTQSHINYQLGGGVIYHGAPSSCVKSINICLATGQEYRLTNAQANAQMWGAIIAGATGIEWFCQDGISQAMCIGGNDGTTTGLADANNVVSNMTYMDGLLTTNAALLNSAVTGQCYADSQNTSTNALTTVSNTTTASFCTGILTITTSVAAVPGVGLAHSYGGATYLIAQSDRVSAAGASYTFTLTGLAGKTATVFYDSDAQYDAGHSTAGNTIGVLNGSGQFTDTLGANGDDYQTKIYKIQ